ncbi:MAG TPA: LacI family DNA-binding transcriptional regulator [Fimbriimonas sp.]|nr:LacI family DNA-binding transcriptional regulator [Fimbriimonas sp.]
MATLKDVAGIAAVSTSTASRILHGGTIRVAPETRERVIRAAESLNYRANSVARSLRTRITRTVGILIPDIQNLVYAQLIAGAEEAAQSNGYALLLMNSSSQERRRAFFDLLAEDRLDGLIIADATLEDHWIEHLQGSGKAFLLVNRHPLNSAPYLTLDEQAGAALGVRHLISLGHRNIAYFSGPPGHEGADERKVGALLEAQALGAPIPADHMFACGLAGEGADAAVEQMLSLRERPTAIATGSIVIAFAAAKSIQNRRLRIPEDISIIGFHDTPVAAYVTPGITTVEMPLLELGRRAMVHILSRVSGIDCPSETIRTPAPRIVLRQSTGPRGDSGKDRS